MNYDCRNPVDYENFISHHFSRHINVGGDYQAAVPELGKFI